MTDSWDPLIKTMTIGITALFPCDMLLCIIVTMFMIAIFAPVRFM